MGEIRYLFTLAGGLVGRLIRLSVSKGDGR